MIVTRTPYRVSLFGGGTDHPRWFKEHGGQVLSFTIDKYCYISIRDLPPFFNHKFRVVYSKVEETKDVNEISHPAIREILKYRGISNGVEVHHHGDLPARSGVGSSSAFAVGLLHATSLLKNKLRDQETLAKEAIFIEQEVLSEVVGSQDQIACALGGINQIRFLTDGNWMAGSLSGIESLASEIENRAVLVYSGLSRTSSDVSRGIFEDFHLKANLLRRNSQLVEEALSVYRRGENLDQWGDLLAESWSLKAQINHRSTNSELERFRNYAKDCGALGWKILGAGGGGFFLFWLRKDDKERFLNDFQWGIKVPFKVEFEGSTYLKSSNVPRYGI